MFKPSLRLSMMVHAFDPSTQETKHYLSQRPAQSIDPASVPNINDSLVNPIIIKKILIISIILVRVWGMLLLIYQFKANLSSFSVSYLTLVLLGCTLQTFQLYPFYLVLSNGDGIHSIVLTRPSTKQATSSVPSFFLNI